MTQACFNVIVCMRLCGNEWACFNVIACRRLCRNEWARFNVIVCMRLCVKHVYVMSAADSACIATTEHMPTPTLTEVEIRRTDGSLHKCRPLCDHNITDVTLPLACRPFRLPSRKRSNDSRWTGDRRHCPHRSSAQPQ